MCVSAMFEPCSTYRATMTHASIPKEEREKTGVTDTLVSHRCITVTFVQIAHVSLLAVSINRSGCQLE